MLKIYDYIQIKYPHKIDKCNFISKVLNHVVFGAAYRPGASWLMVNVCFNVHDNGRVV